jgi:predicted component of type VI protein secretion system
MQKILLGVIIIATITLLSGCAKEKKDETINPFSPSSMVNTYDNSKDKINANVEKQNAATTKVLNDTGINE